MVPTILTFRGSRVGGNSCPSVTPALDNQEQGALPTGNSGGQKGSCLALIDSEDNLKVLGVFSLTASRVNRAFKGQYSIQPLDHGDG